MTQLKWKNNVNTPSFNNLLDDFFYGNPSIYGNERNRTPVNIREVEGGYELEVLAPGWEKEAFSISLEKNLLTIAAEKGEEGQDTGKYIRREFRKTSFKRSFTVENTIDSELISATYVNGILTVNLPRKANVKEAVRNINVR